MRLGGTVQNTLQGGETEKRGGETKILKRGQAGFSNRKPLLSTMQLPSEIFNHINKHVSK